MTPVSPSHPTRGLINPGAKNGEDGTYQPGTPSRETQGPAGKGTADLDPQATWELALDQLKGQMPQAAFERWLCPTRLLSAADGTAATWVSAPEARAWLGTHFATLTSRILSSLVEQLITAVFVLDRQPPAAAIYILLLDEPLYSAITRPEQRFLLHTYLFRWLPFVGLKMLLTALVMRCAFEQTIQQEVNKTACRQPFQVTSAAIHKLSGIRSKTLDVQMTQVVP